MKIQSNSVDVDINIYKTLEKLQKEYRTVYWEFIDGNIYVYKPLGRKDYKEILSDEYNLIEKEDEVVKRALLYPDPIDFDFDNCSAGLITNLAKIIMESSSLDSMEKRIFITQYYREEMNEFDNQINCIINEAFPNFDIEEIENWGIEQTAKYLASAEWKLVNLRGVSINYDYLQQQQEAILNQQDNVEKVEQSEENPKQENESNKKTKMSPQKLAELKAKFPEIQWDNDSVMQEGIESFKRGHANTVAPALRTPDQF